MSAEKFYQSLTYLVPTGFAWPRDSNTTLMRTLRGVAGSFSELHDWTLNTAADWLPHRTRNRLAEWEQATGLPDVCFGPLQTMDARRGHLLSRLRGPSGFYADSSPAALGAIVAVIANMGFTATAHYNTRFRCRRDRVGRRLGRNDGKLYVLMAMDGLTLRVGTGRAGDRLIERSPAVVEMACALERYVPARFELNVVFI